jgi:hypothetical protein
MFSLVIFILGAAARNSSREGYEVRHDYMKKPGKPLEFACDPAKGVLIVYRGMNGQPGSRRNSDGGKCVNCHHLVKSKIERDGLCTGAGPYKFTKKTW